jgi:hypothetical protein
MSQRYRTNDGEYESKRTRDLGTDALPLFAGETGIEPPRARDVRESPEARRDRVIAGMGDEDKRRDWIDRIHAALVAKLARTNYDGVVSANEARSVYLAFPDADPSIDFRFLAALWRRAGWVLRDWDGKSEAPGTHCRRIARYRYDPKTAARGKTVEAA